MFVRVRKVENAITRMDAGANYASLVPHPRGWLATAHICDGYRKEETIEGSYDDAYLWALRKLGATLEDVHVLEPV